jgi:hypothetical protein
MSRFLSVAMVLGALAAPARAVPRLGTHVIRFDPHAARNVVNTHTLFLNRCTGGCTVNVGSPDARTSTSDIPSRPSTLSANPYDDASWNAVVTCVQGMMSRFNIQVVDTQPTSGNFFEVMIAGTPEELGLDGNYGGIADYSCNAPGQCVPYISNDLVFDFSEVWQSDPENYPDPTNQDCSVAAQEIAHAWSLDHVVDATDPMTYNLYNSMRQYHDNEVCGSDCTDVGGVCQGPFGATFETCSGTCGETGSSQATHTCMSTGTATQNEVTAITDLFGASGTTPPTVSIASPASGAAVPPGFPITVNCSSSDGVQEVDLSIDDNEVASLTAAPFAFQAASTIPDGAHTLSVMCTTNVKSFAIATETVIVGTKCSQDSQCPTDDICYEMACIPGPNASDGLGATCKNDSQCASNACASDGSMSVCVVPCDPSNPQCPSGFGCLTAGTSGECWPGAANGDATGCCDAGHGAPTGPLLLAFGVAVSWFTRRRPARSAS